MGKVEGGLMKKRKKKGRPSLLDLQKRAVEQDEDELESQTLISSKPNRSGRRNSNLNEGSPVSDWVDGVGEEGYDDDEDERKEKKVKLVGRLPHSSDQQHFNLSFSNSGPICNHEASDKNRKIGTAGVRSGNIHADIQDKKVQKAMDTGNGSPFVSGPTTPLPDKKLLVFILDRLQKKDTHGAFSAPVDLEELTDYCEVIDHPMDFGTVRKKLSEGIYTKLEEFEKDVLLICSNAMEYNAPDTIYFRQARAIQELAKRDFDNLREVNENGEPQPKVVRRGRPPSKNSKKEFASPPPPPITTTTRVAPEFSSDAIPTTGGENTTNSNYNLRKGSMSYRFQANDVYLRTSHLTSSNDLFNDMTSDWNSEFPASVLKAEAKHTKKTFSIDENRRDTYKLSLASTCGHEPYLLSSPNIGNMNRFVGMGLNVEHGYSRSLARFASNLGPVAWKIASKKIEHALPPGVKFGPGWVGENDVSSNNSAHDDGHHPSLGVTNNRLCEASAAASSKGPMNPPPPQPKNGYNASSLGCGNSSSQLERPEDASFSRSNNDSNNTTMIPGMAGNHMFKGMSSLAGSYPKYNQQQPDLGIVQPWQGSSSSSPVPPDINGLFQGSNLPPGLNLRSIDSPKQPDLALQL